MAWSSITNEISIEIVLLYLSAIFWTLGYDTIYGAQDMSDDEMIGLKSTAIKFKNNISLFVTSSYLITIILLFYIFKNYIGNNTFTFFIIAFTIILAYQIIELKKNKSENYLRLFKINNYAGLFLFLSIYSINL